MNKPSNFPALVERFFTRRLIQERGASSHTVASYRDTFRLLLKFAQQQLRKRATSLAVADLDSVLIAAFLKDLEATHRVCARTRNLRLTAIRSFFRFVSIEHPEHLAHLQRILAIPLKRTPRPQVNYLTRSECQALLSVPDVTTWIGRRDRTLLLVMAQTGLRLSELLGLDRQSVVLGTGAHIRCLGKGRKERSTPLTREAASAVRMWLRERPHGDGDVLFPSIHGGRLSADAVQRLLAKHVRVAQCDCPSLNHKHVTPHVLRHGAAMELLQAGVDSSVIALWLGHESTVSTQRYFHAHMALKEAALAKTTPLKLKPARYRPEDRLMDFLGSL
jgi:integrase/recombinase XerD